LAGWGRRLKSHEKGTKHVVKCEKGDKDVFHSETGEKSQREKSMTPPLGEGRTVERKRRVTLKRDGRGEYSPRSLGCR